MESFSLSADPIDHAALREQVLDPKAGGFCSFEGWVRNHHQGRAVDRLEYEAYPPLAVKEGQRILNEAKERFAIEKAVCVHHVGPLEIGGLAVVVCVSAAHRDAAFDACRFLMEALKSRAPFWKKETLADGTTRWVAMPPFSTTRVAPTRSPSATTPRERSRRMRRTTPIR